MKISYERSGGFAGLTLSAQVDTASLGAAEREDWEALVRSASFFSLPGKIGDVGRLRDPFQYLLQVESDGRIHRVEITGAPPAGALASLISRLQASAKRG